MLPTKGEHVTYAGYYSSRGGERIQWDEPEWVDASMRKSSQDRIIEQVEYFLKEGICDRAGAVNILLSSGMNNLKVVEYVNRLAL